MSQMLQIDGGVQIRENIDFPWEITTYDKMLKTRKTLVFS